MKKASIGLDRKGKRKEPRQNAGTALFFFVNIG